jgi:signal transduction histidine kinase/ActR/RegA family two-component response regulator
VTAAPPPDAHRAHAELEALAALGRAIATARTAEEIGARCADSLIDLTGAARVAFGVREPDGHVPRLVARGDWAERDRQALLELAARAGPLALGGDVTAQLAAHGVALADPVSEWVGVPIGAGGTLLGALSLAARPGGALRPGALAAAQAIAAQAGVALQNTRLLLALSQGKREWEGTVDAIGDGICVLDARGTIRRANRAFCDLADVPVTAVAGRPWIRLVPPAWAETFQRVIDEPGSTMVSELRAGERLFHVTALHLTDAGLASVVLVVSDQTEKRRLQEQLLQSEKMSAIGQLIAGVAHDLNNPLASVVGFADYLAEQSDATPPEMREPLRAIQQEAERAANIVKNLLDFARKQEGRRKVRPIDDVLAATLLLLRNQLMAAKIDAEVDVAPGVPPVLMDTNQIQQVFVNLISNAAHAIRSSGVGSRIVIRAVSWLDGLAITVEDDGPGIPPEDAQRIFEPFFTTKPAGEGTGLGLSICQGIVKEHGGRLTLVPTQRRGAVFQVELPAGAAPATIVPPPAAAPVRRLRILVVDDEPHIQHYMRATLEAWGHTVTVAANGKAGLDHALWEPFDVIICDLRMPELGGREMFERLSAERPDAAARVVFSTGDTVRGDTLAFLESMQRPYLRKPFTLVELRAALADAVRRTA